MEDFVTDLAIAKLDIALAAIISNNLASRMESERIRESKRRGILHLTDAMLCRGASTHLAKFPAARAA
jgi:hypothetical protein